MLVIASILSSLIRMPWRSAVLTSTMAKGARCFRRFGRWASVSVVVGLSLTGCREQAIANPRQIAIEQSWELTSGDVIEGFLVAAGLGDISIQMNGASVHAPFLGEVEASALGQSCAYFSSPEVPAYLFRYCGLDRFNVGEVEQGQKIGKAVFLHFATLRRQPEGTWVIVEPSTHVLERSLKR